MTERLGNFALPAALVAALIVGACGLCGTAAAQGAPAATLSEPLPCLSACEPPPEVDQDRSILVLQVGWDTGNPETSTGLAKHELGSYVGYLRNHVNDWFGRQASGFRPWQVTGGGEFMIEPPAFLIDETAPCPFSDQNIIEGLRFRVLPVARRAGLNPDAYAVIAITWENDICGRSSFELSQAPLGEKRYGTIGLSRQGLGPLQALGHSLGLYPAHTLECVGNGVRVTLSGSCEFVRNGDPYDVMGSGSGAINAQYASGLGWLGSGDQLIDLAAGTYSQTFNLRPWTGASGPGRALRLRDGASTFWLEYRQPTGVDAPAFNEITIPVNPGLLVRLQYNVAPLRPYTVPLSQLLDMTPQTKTFADAPLAVGQTWTNPLGSMQIRLDGANATGATLTISSQKVPVPKVAGLERGPATKAIQAAGLFYAGSKNVNTVDCDLIGKVVSSIPGSGTLVPRGSGVTVTIGEGDRSRICQ